MWLKTAVYFAYNLFLSVSAGVGAARLLHVGEWSPVVGTLVFALVLFELDGRLSIRQALFEEVWDPRKARKK